MSRPEPREFLETRWSEWRAADHDGVPLLVLLREAYVYRCAAEPRTVVVPTGLHKLIMSGQTYMGTLAYCLELVAAYRRTNPDGLSDATLDIVDGFFNRVGGQGWPDGHSARGSGPSGTASRSTPP